MSTGARSSLPPRGAIELALGDGLELRPPEPFIEHDFPPLLGPDHSYGSITDRVDGLVLAQKTSIGWWTGFLIGMALVGVLLLTMTLLVFVGVGIWGVMIPVAWGYAITSFVWWIGIGHAGTLISAILFLLKQHWRTSINRFAEAMTIFAVVQAGLYPVFHLGRPWFFYWLIPYPSTMGVWPQFRSPLIWDFFAVSTYFTVSLIFWYLGMIPDLASIRDRASSRIRRVVYGVLALGWRGSARHWQRYEQDLPRAPPHGIRGFIRATVVPRGLRAQKRIYSVTDAGMAELRSPGASSCDARRSRPLLAWIRLRLALMTRRVRAVAANLGYHSAISRGNRKWKVFRASYSPPIPSGRCHAGRLGRGGCCSAPPPTATPATAAPRSGRRPRQSPRWRTKPADQSGLTRPRQPSQPAP